MHAILMGEGAQVFRGSRKLKKERRGGMVLNLRRQEACFMGRGNLPELMEEEG